MLVYTLPTGDMTAGFAFVLGRQAQAKFERKNLYTFSDVILLQVTLYIYQLQTITFYPITPACKIYKHL